MSVGHYNGNIITVTFIQVPLMIILPLFLTPALTQTQLLLNSHKYLLY